MSAIDVDQTQGECLVYAFKEGLLSAVAHDLKIRVTRWKLHCTEDRSNLHASFDATSLRVVCVMRDGHPELNAPSERDRQTIEKHLLEDVLQARRYPTIELDAKVDVSLRLTGTLTLHGVARPIITTIQQSATHYVSNVTVNQIDYRIKPFSAMLGALKVKPHVHVALTVNLPFSLTR